MKCDYSSDLVTFMLILPNHISHEKTATSGHPSWRLDASRSRPTEYFGHYGG